MWEEVTAVVDGLVSFSMYFREQYGRELVSRAKMRYRSEDEIRTSLEQAGFVVDDVYGGWNREPVGSGDGKLIVLASRH